jgi:hypothetical protein
MQINDAAGALAGPYSQTPKCAANQPYNREFI